MSTSSAIAATVFRVVDALHHPHGGWILRLRVDEGSPPSLSRIRSGGLRVQLPDGTEQKLEVTGFPVTGGKAEDARVRRTGRVDVHVNSPSDGRNGPPLPGTHATLGQG